MIYLLLDTIISSLTNFKTCLLAFYLPKKIPLIELIFITIITTYLTNNYTYILIIPIINYLNNTLKKSLSNQYLLYTINYLLIFNLHITYQNFITFLISVLFYYFDPYN